MNINIVNKLSTTFHTQTQTPILKYIYSVCYYSYNSVMYYLVGGQKYVLKLSLAVAHTAAGFRSGTLVQTIQVT